MFGWSMQAKIVASRANARTTVSSRATARSGTFTA